jgi:TPP-dependent pyruvate/acetoin dehydrogenase alpha subunit
MASLGKDKILNSVNKVLQNRIKIKKEQKYLFLIRAAELAFIELSKLGKIRGPLHTSVGQEAVAVSVCSKLKINDALFSTHRGHGHYLAKGGNLTKLLLELFGDKNGCCAGLGGSMHVADLEKNIVGSNGIVGAGVPIACGHAMGQKMSRINGISVVFFGDGAMNQGVVMESLNMAAIYKLPILFACENNYYAYSTKSKDMSKTSLYLRARGFGIDSYNEDGMNLKPLSKKISLLIAKVRKKKLPVFIEFQTYRYHRHFATEMPRHNDYIDKKTRSKMFKKDPCYLESKRLGLDIKQTDKLIDLIKNCIVKEGLKLTK